MNSSTSLNKELAQQILDVIMLRPEVQLCYLGIGDRCFEIFEASKDDWTTGSVLANHESDTENEDLDDLDDANDSDDDDEFEAGNHGTFDDSDDDSSEEEPADESESKTYSDLREILFYVEKVDIFRARLPSL